MSEEKKKINALVFAINNAKNRDALKIWDTFSAEPQTTSEVLEQVFSQCSSKLSPLFIARFAWKVH